MVTLVLIVLTAALGFAVWHMATLRPPQVITRRVYFTTVAWIAGVRIALAWLMVAGHYNTPLQVAMYLFAVLLLPEIYYVQPYFRVNALRQATALTLILAATSFLWAAVWLWIWRRLARQNSNVGAAL